MISQIRRKAMSLKLRVPQSEMPFRNPCQAMSEGHPRYSRYLNRMVGTWLSTKKKGKHNAQQSILSLSNSNSAWCWRSGFSMENATDLCEIDGNQTLFYSTFFQVPEGQLGSFGGGILYWCLFVNLTHPPTPPQKKTAYIYNPYTRCIT